MATYVQINPRAEALRVSSALAAILDDHAQDFDIRYCALLPEPEVLAALKDLIPQSDDERRATSEILAALEAGEGVELLYSA
ncbi:MAG: hypothetical protein KGK07_14570 [Chloroflexota bacterium]|nr:hypothetical protein [Chloroflexota bacterium]